MKIVQIVPGSKAKQRLKTMLKEAELGLRETHTTLYRYAEGQWKHKKFKGNIKWDEAMGGIGVAEIKSNDEEAERQLLSSFISYLDRHLGKRIESVSITYR